MRGQIRPLNYMFFTPLYSVRNTGCPQISKENYPKLEENFFFLGVIDPLKRFLHLKMINSAPK
jgi:hypothetical protein